MSSGRNRPAARPTASHWRALLPSAAGRNGVHLGRSHRLVPPGTARWTERSMPWRAAALARMAGTCGVTAFVQAMEAPVRRRVGRATSRSTASRIRGPRDCSGRRRCRLGGAIAEPLRKERDRFRREGMKTAVSGPSPRQPKWAPAPRDDVGASPGREFGHHQPRWNPHQQQSTVPRPSR